MMFFNNFERLCREAGTTANAAVVAIGRPSGTSSNWKKNGTLPKEKELIALADHLNCRVADFFLSETELRYSPDLDRHEAQLMEYYEGLDNNRQIDLLAHALKLYKEQRAEDGGLE